MADESNLSQNLIEKLGGLPADSIVDVIMLVKPQAGLDEALAQLPADNVSDRAKLSKLYYDESLSSLREYLTNEQIEPDVSSPTQGMLTARMSPQQVYGLSQLQYVKSVLENHIPKLIEPPYPPKRYYM